jgi:hypothetical protein
MGEVLTNLNFSPRAIGAFKVLTFGILGTTLQLIERNNGMDNFLSGHMLDFCSTLFFSGAYNAISGKRDSGQERFYGLGVPLAIETFLQGGSKIISSLSSGAIKPWGTFDIMDYPAYLVGYGLNEVFEGAARGLYRSGVTKPIYSILGIDHPDIEELDFLYNDP